MDGLKGQFADYLSVDLDRKPGTVRQYLWRLGYLEEFFGKPADQITTHDLLDLKRRWTMAPETLKSLLVAVRQYHDWGALIGKWERKDTALVRDPRIVIDPSLPLTAAQVALIMGEVTDAYEARLVLFGLYAGTRIGEAASMGGQHWQNGTLKFGSKSLLLRQVPVHPVLAHFRQVLLSVGPCCVSPLQKRKRAMEERVGFEFVAHQLRKSFAATMQDAGVQEKVIQDLLGHGGSVTRRYAPITPRMREAAIQVVNY